MDAKALIDCIFFMISAQCRAVVVKRDANAGETSSAGRALERKGCTGWKHM